MKDHEVPSEEIKSGIPELRGHNFLLSFFSLSFIFAPSFVI